MGTHARIVKDVYAALERKDFDAAYTKIDANVVWSAPNTDWPGAGTYFGQDGIREFRKRIRGRFRRYTQEIDDFIELGDCVVVSFHAHGYGRRTGREMNGDFADVWTVNDGVVTHVLMHADRDEALLAARRAAKER